MKKLLGGGAVLALAVAGIAYAAIPDSSGVIHGCYSKTGALRVIDSSAKCVRTAKRRSPGTRRA